MNDVKDICDRILERPAPPMRDSERVLTIAQRSARRQARITVTMGGLVAAAIVAITAAAGTLDGAPGTPRPAVLLTSVASPSLSPAPDWEKTGPDTARFAQLLAEALPAGYRSQPAFGTHGTDTWTSADSYASRTQLVVSTGKGQGMLSATVVKDGAAAPSGDLCAAAVTARLDAYNPDGDANCQVITIDGVPIRATTTAKGSTATRFLADGFLIVDWHPSWQVPFTIQQLATVAATVQIPE